MLDLADTILDYQKLSKCSPDFQDFIPSADIHTLTWIHFENQSWSSLSSAWKLSSLHNKFTKNIPKFLRMAYKSLEICPRKFIHFIPSLYQLYGMSFSIFLQEFKHLLFEVFFDIPWLNWPLAIFCLSHKLLKIIILNAILNIIYLIKLSVNCKLQCKLSVNCKLQYISCRMYCQWTVSSLKAKYILLAYLPNIHRNLYIS